ncbi:LLM class flavin-dependent oxidoreductase [Paracoccus sp. DMF-8]|uniref:LLM class flavin-dependent oxidoreductase n=1 Tax=Paracoccus sp. DMF-8 TaxID=3019445 RepID=UPI0023E75D6B|nr:LLM class flavin-dependent oxidoreductase [Paracoccus sp. DMF-8]MDF3606997.1 LLM class flavin-dependent oxidoreductase [Paracoccus sp. DMF-8]
MQYSILDLSPVGEGFDISQAIASSVKLAQAAEVAGYHRYWLAEHHNMKGIASAATSVLIGHIAGHTRTMRIGAGGIMLPNHSALQIAEQFGTLAAIHGPRIDLGLGRAPGGDGAVMQALRRNMQNNDDFPNNVVELLGYLGPERPAAGVNAWPGQGSDVPVWILGSSLYGASLAAVLGLPYAFASHFAPGDLDQAVTLYRERFQETQWGTRPHFMLAVNVVAAPTDDEAHFLRTSQQLQFARLRMGNPGLLPKPVEDIGVEVPEAYQRLVNQALAITAVGSPQAVEQQLRGFIEKYQPDELILTGNIHDPDKRIRSFRMAAEIMRGIA